MNIFVTSSSPLKSAQVLPDKHIVKMPLECCQMLSIIASDKWGHGYGTLPKSDGTPYMTDKGAFRNHPCTIWASETPANARWLIAHAFALCEEYTSRYGKVHTCLYAILRASEIFPDADPNDHTPFVRAMPVEFLTLASAPSMHTKCMCHLSPGSSITIFVSQTANLSGYNNLINKTVTTNNHDSYD